ncbi:MAG TPA: dynamin family protein [Syntrophales bacterium]|nr:dynamin family protein [Syntrophales bacterium]HOL59190.1 dynamin family protein [Syntrophales bacterium]HPO35729.1 dynamin family protein [Syntrophales bacterium]
MPTDNLTPADCVLRIVHQATERLNLVSLKRELQVADRLVGQSPLIDVAILGQFKAGKSSFINSLIGRRLLPVGVIPVTTVITRLKYGEREKAIVTHFDGTQEEIPLERLEEFTSEAKNPANKKDVAVVDIELPSLDDYEGLRFVDTPGLGSVFKYHMETSEQWLPEVGAAILAVSAERPLAENDVQLIRELLRYTPRIVLMITKVDLITPEQRQEIIKFFQETLNRELNREFPIFLYSNREGMEKFKHRLDMELLLPLTTNRDREFRSIVKHKIKSLAHATRDYLEVALRTSRQVDSDRENLRAQILGEKSNLAQIEEELIVLTRAQAIHTRTHIEKHLEAFRAPMAEKLREDLKRDMSTWRGNLWQLTRKYEEWMEQNLFSEIDAISFRERKHFFGTLIKAQAALERYLETFRTMIGMNMERVLGVKMTPPEWKIEVIEPARPDIRVGHVFEFHFDLLWFIIPMFIFRPLFERHFLRLVYREVFVNFSRLGAQWEMSINRTIEDMRKQASRYIREEIQTIESLLSQTQGQSEEIAGMMSKLEEALDAISKA